MRIEMERKHRPLKRHDDKYFVIMNSESSWASCCIYIYFMLKAKLWPFAFASAHANAGYIHAYSTLFIYGYHSFYSGDHPFSLESNTLYTYIHVCIWHWHSTFCWIYPEAISQIPWAQIFRTFCLLDQKKNGFKSTKCNLFVCASMVNMAFGIFNGILPPPPSCHHFIQLLCEMRALYDFS